MPTNWRGSRDPGASRAANIPRWTRGRIETAAERQIPSDMRILQGSCLCGACTYEVEDDFEYALICHCSQCRRATGAGSKPFAGIRAERLRARAASALWREWRGRTGQP
ncbi:GFA family protein [Novosphingobium sp.]|uniref:GFA family protein n=1 Tax=Novosphingobium sp. TaxID=1874826 RepID=UPI003D6CC490